MLQGIFNYDNPVWRFIGKLGDLIILNILWIVCSIPVFTAGASTTAVYYVTLKLVRDEDDSTIRSFFRSFKSNFKQAALAALILTGVVLFLGLDCYIMYQFAAQGQKSGVLYVVFLVLIVLVVMLAVYLFAYMARFENSLGQSFKNAALIAVANLPWSLLLLVLLAASAFGLWMLPWLMILLPAVYILVANFILERIFRKYMSAEDLEAEQERNQEFFN